MWNVKTGALGEHTPPTPPILLVRAMVKNPSKHSCIQKVIQTKWIIESFVDIFQMPKHYLFRSRNNNKIQ